MERQQSSSPGENLVPYMAGGSTMPAALSIPYKGGSQIDADGGDMTSRASRRIRPRSCLRRTTSGAALLQLFPPPQVAPAPLPSDSPAPKRIHRLHVQGAPGVQDYAMDEVLICADCNLRLQTRRALGGLGHLCQALRTYPTTTWPPWKPSSSQTPTSWPSWWSPSRRAPLPAHPETEVSNTTPSPDWLSE